MHGSFSAVYMYTENMYVCMYVCMYVEVNEDCMNNDEEDMYVCMYVCMYVT